MPIFSFWGIAVFRLASATFPKSGNERHYESKRAVGKLFFIGSEEAEKINKKRIFLDNSINHLEYKKFF
jgi:hypothetical protein